MKNFIKENGLTIDQVSKAIINLKYCKMFYKEDMTYSIMDIADYPYGITWQTAKL